MEFSGSERMKSSKELGNVREVVGTMRMAEF